MADPLAICDTPDTLPANTPARLSADGKRLAYLRPTNHRQTEQLVELIARTSRGLVVIRMPAEKPGGKPVWSSVYGFRMVDASTRRPLKRDDFADLPWQGSGPDPDAPKKEAE